MIRLSVLYPGGEEAKFDHDYYRNRHVPMCCSAWNVGAEIDKGINGPNVAAVHFFFESMDQHQARRWVAAGTGAIMADVANYTDIAPVMQISEVVDRDRTDQRGRPRWPSPDSPPRARRSSKGSRPTTRRPTGRRTRRCTTTSQGRRCSRCWPTSTSSARSNLPALQRRPLRQGRPPYKEQIGAVSGAEGGALHYVQFSRRA